ncbi:MAG: ABC transporter permease [Lachnospiraceae bacterium]
MGSKLKKLASSREMSLVIVLIILCGFIQFRNSNFLTAKTIGDMFQNYSVTMVLAIGMMGVLLIGGIDISIGSTVALSGMITALMMRDGLYENVFVGFLVSILVGLAAGVIIGLVISRGGVLPIIATLGFMNIYRGITYLVADSRWVAAYEIPDGYKAFALGKVFGVLNNLVLIMIICYIIFFVVMKWTKFGRKIYAVGSNPEAAEVSGIKIKNIKLACYAILGALSGLVGAMWVSYYASAQGDMGTGIEMDVIAACVIGGVSLTGGRGSVVGVFLGSLTMAIISNALPLIGVSQFWQNGIKGLIIIVAVILNVITQRVIDRNNLRRREM